MIAPHAASGAAWARAARVHYLNASRDAPLRQALDVLLECARKGQRQRVLFLVPPNNKCSGPLYEMAMMADRGILSSCIYS